MACITAIGAGITAAAGTRLALPDAVDRPDSIVFTDLMCSSDPVILKQLGKFIFLALRDRRVPS